MKPLWLLLGVLIVIVIAIIAKHRYDSANRYNKNYALSFLPLVDVCGIPYQMIHKCFSNIESQLYSLAPLLKRRTDYYLFIYAMFQCVAYEMAYPQFAETFGKVRQGDLFHAIFFNCEYFSVSKRADINKDLKLISEIYADVKNEVKSSLMFGLYDPDENEVFSVAAQEFLRFVTINPQSSSFAISLKKVISEDFRVTAYNMDNHFVSISK